MSDEKASDRGVRRGMPGTFAVTAALTLAVLALDAYGAIETPPPPTAIEFLDVRTVEHTHFLERQVTPVRRYERNPIIPGANDIATVLKGKDGVVRMWYKSKVPVPGLPPHGGRIVIGTYRLRYAESTDGINWTFPKLNLKEVDGTKANNVVLKYAGHIAKIPEEYRTPDLDSAGRALGVNCILDRELTPMPHTRGRFTALSDIRRCSRILIAMHRTLPSCRDPTIGTWYYEVVGRHQMARPCAIWCSNLYVSTVPTFTAHHVVSPMATGPAVPTFMSPIKVV